MLLRRISLAKIALHLGLAIAALPVLAQSNSAPEIQAELDAALQRLARHQGCATFNGSYGATYLGPRPSSGTLSESGRGAINRAVLAALRQTRVLQLKVTDAANGGDLAALGPDFGIDLEGMRNWSASLNTDLTVMANRVRVGVSDAGVAVLFHFRAADGSFCEERADLTIPLDGVSAEPDLLTPDAAFGAAIDQMQDRLTRHPLVALRISDAYGAGCGLRDWAQTAFLGAYFPRKTRMEMQDFGQSDARRLPGFEQNPEADVPEIEILFSALRPAEAAVLVRLQFQESGAVQDGASYTVAVRNPKAFDTCQRPQTGTARQAANADKLLWDFYSKDPTAEKMEEYLRSQPNGAYRSEAIALIQEQLRDADRAAWDRLQKSRDPASLGRYLEDFPYGLHRAGVQARMELLVAELEFWKVIQGSDKLSDYEGFLIAFPDGPYAGLAQNARDDLAKRAADKFTAETSDDPVVDPETRSVGEAEARMWAQVQANPTLEEVAIFLRVFGNGVHAAAARQLQRELEAEARIAAANTTWAKIRNSKQPQAFLDYIDAHPDGPHVAEARRRIEEIRRVRDAAAWSTARSRNTVESYGVYIREFPGGDKIDEAYGLREAAVRRKADEDERRRRAAEERKRLADEAEARRRQDAELARRRAANACSAVSTSLSTANQAAQLVSLYYADLNQGRNRCAWERFFQPESKHWTRINAIARASAQVTRVQNVGDNRYRVSARTTVAGHSGPLECWNVTVTTLNYSNQWRIDRIDGDPC